MRNMDLVCQPGDQLFNLQDNKLYTLVSLNGDTGFNCTDAKGNAVSFYIATTTFQKVVG